MLVLNLTHYFVFMYKKIEVIRFVETSTNSSIEFFSSFSLINKLSSNRICFRFFFFFNIDQNKIISLIITVIVNSIFCSNESPGHLL